MRNSKLISVGNAIVDIISKADDDFLISMGYKKGTALSAQATKILMREFLNHSKGSDWVDITLGKNFNRVHRWMDNLEDGEEEKS